MKFFSAKFLIIAFFLGTLPLVAQESGSPPVPQGEPHGVPIWEIIIKSSSAGSAIVTMIPLALLSVVAIMLVFYFFFAFTKNQIASERFVRTAEALIHKRDFLRLLAEANSKNEATAQVIAKSVDFITKNPEASFDDVREVALAEGTRQASSINQQISYLSDIGAIAPMLGLLGTVMGMIQSFDVLANDVAASRPMLLAEGVSQALITTAAGLFVGIPAFAFYAFFRGRSQALISELEAASIYLLSLLALAHKKQDKPANPVKPSDSPDFF